MECGECNIRSSVGYCHECDVLLCEICAQTCERCKKTVCKSHIQRTSSGRRICVSCVVHHYDKRARQAKERREMRAEAVIAPEQASHGKKKSKTGPPAASRPVESFSFESLQAEADGLAVAFSAPSPSSEPEPYSPIANQDALNQRVLTGSAPQRRPVWVTGLMLAILAWVMFAGIFIGDSHAIQHFIFNVLSVIFALGAVVWTGPSSFAKGNKELRIRSRMAFAVGVCALIIAGLALYVRVVG